MTYNFHWSCKHMHLSFKSVCNKEHKGVICNITSLSKGAQWLSGRLQTQGSSLTGVTALWSLSKTHLSKLSTGSTRVDPSLFN